MSNNRPQERIESKTVGLPLSIDLEWLDSLSLEDLLQASDPIALVSDFDYRTIGIDVPILLNRQICAELLRKYRLFFNELEDISERKQVEALLIRESLASIRGGIPYTRVVNRCAKDFLTRYSGFTGRIYWEKVVASMLEATS